ncbi:MAG: NEW3 domain-containing protein, partial [Terriglobales bacterium]
SNFDMENSQNQTWLTGDVFGWYTLAMSMSSCDTNTLASLAKQAATAAGVSLNNYKRIVYGFPQSNGCGWSGLGTVGGNPSSAWINGSFNLLVVGHEMGHNFGLYHAHSLICPGTTLGTNCSTGEYGDPFDIMGNYTASHFDAFHKEQIGWLNYGSSLPISTVSSSGAYTIPPYETGSGSKALKIAKDASTFYYVEYRQPVGFDSVLSSYPASTSGVLVRTGAPSDSNSSFLLDTNPGTSSFSDAALGVGKTFTDSAAGVTITLASANASGATVNVTLGTSSCAHNNPSVAITPAQASGAAGATVAYTVSVTNNDSPACSTDNFNLAATVPAGWSAAFTSQSLTLAPGASGSATLNVTSAASAANGVNTVTASATNAGATSFKGSASATYTVSTPAPANFSLSASPSSVTIAQGASGTTLITSTISGSFNSAVALSASGMPSGVTATFSPSSIAAPGSGTSTVTFSAGSSVTAGAYPLTITGTGGGLSRTTAISVTVNNGAGPMGLRFVPLAPCRVADTRNAAGPLGGPAIAALGSRSFPVAQSACNVPSTAKAYSLNVTAVPKTGVLNYITVWPSDQPQPFVSLLNATDGRVKAVAAIVPAAATSGGAVSVYATDATDIILDINGYFVDAVTNPSALAFFTLPPCRVVDTRWPTSGSLGPPSLLAWQERSFPILATSCNIPTTAQAYSLNFTVVPKMNIGFLATWPTGPGSMPGVSTLNVTTGAVTANAAIVSAGQSGAISVMATGDTDLVIDINGYFAPSTSPNDLSFYTVPPCRVRDTRENTGLFSTTPLAIDTSASRCGIPPSAQAIVVNATVVPAPPGLGFLTLWPHGGTVPNVSTLNAADGFITSNMAIVPTTNGVIDAYGSEPTQLVLDTSGYLAP